MRKILLIWAGLALLLVLGAAAGCATTTIIPPANPSAPVAIFLVDHGRTTSLVVPASTGGMLRYAYGDWHYYALGEDDLLHGIAALMWPSQGALGRGELEGPATLESVRRQVSSIEHVHAVVVESADVAEFEHNMERLYKSRLDTEVENLSYRMSFVHHPRRYTYLWNSNHAVAAWLRELGCRTEGPSFRASWRVRPTELAHTPDGEGEVSSR